jgi:uncharacterized membrane protein
MKMKGSAIKFVIGIFLLVLGFVLFFLNGQISAWLSGNQCQSFDVRSCQIFTYNEIAIFLGIMFIVAGLTVSSGYVNSIRATRENNTISKTTDTSNSGEPN